MAPWPYPRWIAHRGAGKLAPENTLAAFRLGASLGYRAFECDVKLSADGVPFLLHDATLDRTTDAGGSASERSWSDLSRIDAGGWHSATYAGEPVLSLRNLAAYLRRNRFALDLEIKPTPGSEAQTGAVVAEEVAHLWHDDSLMPLLSSFSADALRAAQQAVPGLRRALLIDEPRPDAFDLVQQLGCVALITNHNLMDAALLARIHAAGLRALVYTVNEPDHAQSLLGLGIDGIVTDAVDRFTPDALPG